VDHHCHHLDTCLSPLSQQSVLIYPGAFQSESLTLLRSGWVRIHELSTEEAYQFMGNGIVVEGGYIIPHVTPHLQEIWKQKG
jgi:N-dimethylarginine dimethylaminohydrolase